MGCVWLVAVMQCEPLLCQQEYGPWASEGTAPLSETSLLVTGCFSAAWERPEVPPGEGGLSGDHRLHGLEG